MEQNACHEFGRSKAGFAQPDHCELRVQVHAQQRWRNAKPWCPDGSNKAVLCGAVGHGMRDVGCGKGHRRRGAMGRSTGGKPHGRRDWTWHVGSGTGGMGRGGVGMWLTLPAEQMESGPWGVVCKTWDHAFLGLGHCMWTVGCAAQDVGRRMREMGCGVLQFWRAWRPGKLSGQPGSRVSAVSADGKRCQTHSVSGLLGHAVVCLCSGCAVAMNCASSLKNSTGFYIAKVLVKVSASCTHTYPFVHSRR